MAYNSFDEYNTEAAYNDKETTAKKWAELAKAAGYTRQSALDTASPSWKNSKYMKGALDEVFGVDTPTNENNPVVETPKEEATTEQTVKEKPMSENAKQFQKGIDEANEIINKAENNEYEQAKNANKKADENVTGNATTHKEMAEELVPDYWEDSIPTSLFRYYKKDGLGDAGSKDAKIRLGYLIVNNLASGLKQMSNNFAAAAGRSPAFTDTESEWNKIKRTNLEEGLKRANEKKAATMQEVAMLLRENTNNKQKAIEVAREFGENTRLQRAFNAVSQQQKVDVLNARIMLGDYLGKQNKVQFTNYLLGHLEDGGDVKSAATMFLAKYGTDAIKDFLKNGGSIDDILTGTAGISGGNSGNKEILDINGKPFKLSTVATTEEKEKFDKAVKALYEKYKTGQVSKEQFIELYTPYVKAKEGHPSMSYLQPENAIKAMDKGRIDKAKKEIKELNDKKGKISFDAYNEQYDNILKNFEKTGGNPSDLAKEKRITKAWVLRNPSK